MLSIIIFESFHAKGFPWNVNNIPTYILPVAEEHIAGRNVSGVMWRSVGTHHAVLKFDDYTKRSDGTSGPFSFFVSTHKMSLRDNKDSSIRHMVDGRALPEYRIIM